MSKSASIPAILSNLIWVKRSELSDQELEYCVRQATVVGKDSFTGDPIYCRCYELLKNYIGLPRAKFRDYFDLEDRTSFPDMDWPEVTFPAGMTWRGSQFNMVNGIMEYFEDNNDARLEMGCGLGKSLVALSVASCLQTPTLILTHKESLADRWFEESRFFPGLKMGLIQQDNWNYKDKHITVASVQTLWSRRQYLQKHKEISSHFGFVVLDEAHKFSSSTFEYILRQFPAKHKLGISATWRRKDGLEPALGLHLGPISNSVERKNKGGTYWLLDIATNMRCHPRMPIGTQISRIAESEDYAILLAKQCLDAYKKGRCVLLVSDRRVLLDNIERNLISMAKQGGFSQLKVGQFVGGVLAEARKKILKSANVTLATYGAANEGTDCPRWDTLILGTGRSDIEQVVGRIEREKSGKRPGLVIDPVWNMSGGGIFARQMEKRIKQYKQLGYKNGASQTGT